MEIGEHIRAVGQDAKLLTEAAEQSGLDANVPSCPGWDTRELLRHLGMIHLWAAGHITELHEGSWHTHDQLTEFWPDDGLRGHRQRRRNLRGRVAIHPAG